MDPEVASVAGHWLVTACPGIRRDRRAVVQTVSQPECSCSAATTRSSPAASATGPEPEPPRSPRASLHASRVRPRRPPATLPDDRLGQLSSTPERRPPTQPDPGCRSLRDPCDTSARNRPTRCWPHTTRTRRPPDVASRKTDLPTLLHRLTIPHIGQPPHAIVSTGRPGPPRAPRPRSRRRRSVHLPTLHGSSTASLLVPPTSRLAGPRAAQGDPYNKVATRPATKSSFATAAAPGPSSSGLIFWYLYFRVAWCASGQLISVVITEARSWITVKRSRRNAIRFT